MEIFKEYLALIENPQHRARTEEVINWVVATFPNLAAKFAWNQPMFTDHGTFIIGFSVAKPHLAVAPEGTGIVHFSEEIKQAGYDRGIKFFRIRWEDRVDYALLERIIRFNMADKAKCTTFWRKE